MAFFWFLHSPPAGALAAPLHTYVRYLAVALLCRTICLWYLQVERSSLFNLEAPFHTCPPGGPKKIGKHWIDNRLCPCKLQGCALSSNWVLVCVLVVLMMTGDPTQSYLFLRMIFSATGPGPYGLQGFVKKDKG